MFTCLCLHFPVSNVYLSIIYISPLLMFTRLLFPDPRHWDRAHVQSWLHSMSGSLGLPEISPEKFLMNGKGLCLMTLPMYLYRVPHGGHSLYLDFRARLAHAIAVEAASDT